MTLGETITSLRKEKGWSQKMLADRVAANQAVVSGWELGRSQPSPAVIEKIATALGANPDALIELRREDRRSSRGVVPHVPSSQAVRLAEFIARYRDKFEMDEMFTLSAEDMGLIIEAYSRAEG